jgi:hypothetical protein
VGVAAIVGDANRDGNIEENDVVALLKIPTGLGSPCTLPVSTAGATGDHRDDVNCDGVLNGADALNELLAVAGASELPAPSGCPRVGQPSPS